MNSNNILAHSRRVLSSNVVDWAAGSVNTAAAGANFTALGAQAGRLVTIVAPVVGLDVRRVGTAEHVAIPAGCGLTIALEDNVNEVEIRRTDQSNTQVAIRYIWEQ